MGGRVNFSQENALREVPSRGDGPVRRGSINLQFVYHMPIKNTFSVIILCLFLSACSSVQEPSIFLAQGIMVGEATDETAILQTRLTAVPQLTEGEVPGKNGVVRFWYGTTPERDDSWLETVWIEAKVEGDWIVKALLTELRAGTRYYYLAEYGPDIGNVSSTDIAHFRTHPGEASTDSVSFAVVTGMNYYHFHYGRYDSSLQYMGEDKEQGYPALEAIAKLEPDYFIGTGDNVYFDHPAERGIQNALKNGKNPLAGLFGGKEVLDEAGMRRKYHVQFVQPRFRQLFSQLGTYWMKDDHDYRVNDSDPYSDFPISHELGIKNFREQLPVVYPIPSPQPTYRTYRLSEDVQIWLIEGRDYRSANDDPDSPEKTIWGEKQKTWIKKTLMESTASFKFFLSPTPMVGPDDAYKKDNHVNHQGFRQEGDAFFDWLTDNEFLAKGFYFICGDRHWQYHAIHPSGFEEFSCGALVDANSRGGRLAGDPKSTDPEALIQQPYVQANREQASGGFLKVSVSRNNQGLPFATFAFYDEKGALLYEVQKK